MARGFIYLKLWDKKCGNIFQAVGGEGWREFH
jgi:hypothetical protein